VKSFDLSGFELIKRDTICGNIDISCNEDIISLFSMTPYFYKTSEENQQRLVKIESLTTEIGFEMLTYKKL
ncbi:MAG: methyltransferase, partial [Oscillospiraceae bacterium]|nr:methyltransferase [Oscillospiraceae bacterium]